MLSWAAWEDSALCVALTRRAARCATWQPVQCTGAILCPERAPDKARRQQCEVAEEPSTDDVIETVGLEREDFTRLEDFERGTARSPEVDLIGRVGSKELEPVPVGDADEQLHTREHLNMPTEAQRKRKKRTRGAGGGRR